MLVFGPRKDVAEADRVSSSTPVQSKSCAVVALRDVTATTAVEVGFSRLSEGAHKHILS